VVTVRVDQPDGDDGPARSSDVSGAPASRQSPDTGGTSDAVTSDKDGTRDKTDADAERQVRIARVTEHRATVDATYRAYAIDQAYEKVRDIERRTVTPVMKRIEAEDPDRHLAGLEFRLKGRDRLAEKADSHLKSNPELSPEQAVSKVKDAIRYTFVYSDDHYTEGVQADTRRLADDFELIDLRNLWPAAEYKGINTRWRAQESSQVFEVQFHTHASFEAKQSTHGAYEKIRDPATPRGERDKLQDFQRQVSADIPAPRDVSDIKDYP
jgi:hypothetical protein